MQVFLKKISNVIRNVWLVRQSALTNWLIDQPKCYIHNFLNKIEKFYLR